MRACVCACVCACIECKTPPWELLKMFSLLPKTVSCLLFVSMQHIYAKFGEKTNACCCWFFFGRRKVSEFAWLSFSVNIYLSRAQPDFVVQYISRKWNHSADASLFLFSGSKRSKRSKCTKLYPDYNRAFCLAGSLKYFFFFCFIYSLLHYSVIEKCLFMLPSYHHVESQ